MSFDIYILLGMLIIFCASSIQGICGFGKSLVAVPLLALFIPANEVVAVMIVVSNVSGVTMLAKTYKNLSIKKIWVMGLFGIIGTIVGVQLLKIIDPASLKVAMGVIVILSAAMLASGYSVNIKDAPLAYSITGITSGILGGVVSFGGPPIVLFLQNQQHDKNSFRANLSLYFLLIAVTGTINLLLGNMINENVLNYIIFFIPTIIVGTLFGNLLSHKLDEKLFKRIVLGILVVTGISAIIFTFI